MATEGEDKPCLENFTCSICRDIFVNPVIIPCGNTHISCKECVSALVKGKDSKCPVCRVKLKSRSLKSASTISSRMKSIKLPCQACHTEILVAEMNDHVATCDRIDKNIHYFKPVKETAQQIPKNLPNRSTFSCPYCSISNLDCNGLREHCNQSHRSDSTHVVCPICASMPWGNKSQTSSDFIQHLNVRHKFEYDTYVDYGQDDDAMLQAAIQASLENA